MDILNYAPKCIYEDINSILESLQQQSNLLNGTLINIQNKCDNLEIISENEIDQLIDLLRNYTLIKELCLEKCSRILPNVEYTSINDLTSDVEKHQKRSLDILNEVLYYAYEFLKIQSKNVVTDSRLQDHREILQSIINSMLNEFVNVDEIVKQLQPYKIAIQYITKNLTDLTQYAEMLNNTFGAVLFYNIISGNNIEYDSSWKCPYIEVKNTTQKSQEQLISTEEYQEDIPEEEVSKDVESTEEYQEDISEEEVSKDIESTEEYQEDISEEEVKLNLYERILKSINDSDKYIDSNQSLTHNEDTFNEEVALNTICDYIIDGQFACTSLLFREYSKVSKSMETLYYEYGLSVGDPCVQYDYSNVFLNNTIEPLHSWLQISILLREMFISKNKSNECYNYMSYMNSLVQSMDISITSKIEGFNGILSIFEDVGYNMDYILGVRIFDKKNEIVFNIRQQANQMLTYCEQITSIWTHKGMISVTKGLFSCSGGHVYYLIKELSLGNFKVLGQIKQYCYPFSDDDGHMLSGVQLNDKISSYLHELLVNSKHNENDINVCYKTTFIKKFTNVLTFLFQCMEKITNFDMNYINEANIEHYRTLKDSLNKCIKTSIESLSKSSNSDESSKMDKVGMVCLKKTLEYIYTCLNSEVFNSNYYYCDLLKTDYFILNNEYIPYLNANVDSIDGFTIDERIKKHLQKCRYVNSWKDAIKSHVNKLNIGSVNLIELYLKDIGGFSDELIPYLEEASKVECDVESISKDFKCRIDRLFLNESLPNREVMFNILSVENIIKDAITELNNFGFYNTFLECLEKYALKVSKESYAPRNDTIYQVGNSIGYDSDYYTNMVEYINDDMYSMADTLLSMYHNGEEFPKVLEDSNVNQYDEIFKQFTEFCNNYADDLRSPNGYIFMNEFYNKTIRPIVMKLFAGSYDHVKSDELIGSWSKGQTDTKVVYNILTNIGFSIERAIEIDNHTFRMVLSNYEKSNSQLYVIPEKTVFLNQIYNIAQAKSRLDALDITEDTFIIMDYALNLREREYILEVMDKKSNGNKIIVADRCVIMFLTTIPSNIRKIALKVCSLCNASGSISYSTNFRCNFIKEYTYKGVSSLLLGRPYFGKTFILDTISDTLRGNANNIVLKIDALNDDMSNLQSIIEACKTLGIKINAFNDWSTFETSMTRYINKHSNKKVYLLIDNADMFIESCITTLESVPMYILRKLSKQFKDRFRFILMAEVTQRFIDYAKDLGITCNILKPLTYDETIDMFNDYLNASKISINNLNTRIMLASLTFGSPKMVRDISKQILSEVSKRPELFNDTFNYELTQDVIYSALCNDTFIDATLSTFLKTIIGNSENDNLVVSTLYGIVYYLYEHSNVDTFTIEDISKVLSIFDLDDAYIKDIQNGIDLLYILGVVNRVNDDEFFLSHNAYKYYFGSKEFAFDMLDYSTKILKKEGLA
ncbi:MAG: hypothetical protein LUG94_07410 [Ruminococcus sp.]|nr:hypothetical protein [Ruminococcus sp.]